MVWFKIELKSWFACLSAIQNLCTTLVQKILETFCLVLIEIQNEIPSTQKCWNVDYSICRKVLYIQTHSCILLNCCTVTDRKFLALLGSKNIPSICGIFPFDLRKPWDIHDMCLHFRFTFFSSSFDLMYILVSQYLFIKIEIVCVVFLCRLNRNWLCCL